MRGLISCNGRDDGLAFVLKLGRYPLTNKNAPGIALWGIFCRCAIELAITLG